MTANSRRRQRSIRSTDILSIDEVRRVLASLRRAARRSRLRHQVMIIFRLTIGAALRASEIASLELRDLKLDGDRPHINLRKGTTKGGAPRIVPLTWDEGTFHALVEWKRIRVEEMGAYVDEPVVCVLSDRPTSTTSAVGSGPERSRVGAPLTRVQVARKWKSAVRCLGAERQRQLHTHSGRHTFGSYMAQERTLVELRDAMGHSDITTTSLYLHVTPESLDRWGNVFDEKEGKPER